MSKTLYQFFEGLKINENEYHFISNKNSSKATILNGKEFLPEDYVLILGEDSIISTFHIFFSILDSMKFVANKKPSYFKNSQIIVLNYLSSNLLLEYISLKHKEIFFYTKPNKDYLIFPILLGYVSSITEYKIELKTNTLYLLINGNKEKIENLSLPILNKTFRKYLRNIKIKHKDIL